MFDSKIISYRKGSDYLQTRSRHPRKVMPNFALYCDWIIWDLGTVLVDYTKVPRFIFVRSEIDCLNLFIGNVLPKLKNKCVLVTASHDLTMPLGFHKKFGLDWNAIVNNVHIKCWFTENRDLIHPKIRAIPLGLPHPDLPSWIENVGLEGAVWKTDGVARHLVRKDKINKVFACWYDRIDHTSGTCARDENERLQAYEYITGRPDVFDWYAPGLSRWDFLAKLGEYRFVLCPHGGGLDPNPKCWEALIMKAIPIVKMNTMTASLQHLPIAVVENWEGITKASLTVWRSEYEHRLYAKDIGYLMSNSYYVDQINNILN